MLQIEAMKSLKRFYFYLLLFKTVLTLNVNERNWEYDPISIESYSSDPTKFMSEMHVVRLSRGQYAISGRWEWKFDVDNETMVEFTSHYSSTGSKDYKQMAYGVPRQHLYDYLNGFHKRTMMKPMQNCSNLPQYEDKFEPPLEQQTFIFYRCDMVGESVQLPFHLTPGFYKIVYSMYGPVHCRIEFLFRVTSKVV